MAKMGKLAQKSYGSKNPAPKAPKQMKKKATTSATNPGYVGVAGPKAGPQSSSC